MDTKQIKKALVSVYHKEKLDEIIKKLHAAGVSFISTGGTQAFIEKRYDRRSKKFNINSEY